MNNNNNYFIHNAFVVDESKVFRADVLVGHGKIVRIMETDAIVEDLFPEENTVFIDAEGMYLLPGIIDAHVHFREPGLTHKGDMYSESRAAVAGGVTSVMDMPNVVPQTVSNELIEEKQALAKGRMFTNYSFYTGATNHNWDAIRQIDASRVCGIKLFMGSSTGDMLVSNEELLDKLFQITSLPIAVHCEDETIIARNMQQAIEQYGEDIPTELHPKIRCEEACFVSSQKAVDMARRYGTRLHLLHITTAKELDLLSEQYPHITAETCVHYLYLDSRDYPRLKTKMKSNPSIKTPDDRQALLDAVVSGRIAAIGSDHAPHTLEEKENPYPKAPSGIPVVQHSLPLMLEFCYEKKINIQTVVERMCHAPARIYDIALRGFIKEGYFADMTLVNMNKETTINRENILCKCGWSPFEGMTLHSCIEKTFVNGELVFDNGTFPAQPNGTPLLFNRKSTLL
ncbi:MAG: dihydroorotase [Bacteroidales bacterium]|jgi:dihydroorotase|nr:dihydroorotase [Bacteroidales bacterium]